MKSCVCIAFGQNEVEHASVKDPSILTYPPPL